VKLTKRKSRRHELIKLGMKKGYHNKYQGNKDDHAEIL
jgi:hypothetical protein